MELVIHLCLSARRCGDPRHGSQLAVTRERRPAPARPLERTLTGSYCRGVAAVVLKSAALSFFLQNALGRDSSAQGARSDERRIVSAVARLMASLLDADAELARALIARDPNAPRALWRRFSPMVFRILRRAMGLGHDVEDLVQDVFLCVFEKVPALRDPKALKAFVMSFTVLTARGELRRLWRQRWLRLRDKGDVSGDALVHVDLDGREALGRFYAVLDRINADDRTMFVLRFVEGLELVEVAAASGWSLATTKRRLARAWSKVLLLVERDPILRTYLTPTAVGYGRRGRRLAAVQLLPGRQEIESDTQRGVWPRSRWYAPIISERQSHIRHHRPVRGVVWFIRPGETSHRDGRD